MDFGFAENLRQTEVKSEYRKKAENLDAEYHQLGDATTFKSIVEAEQEVRVTSALVA
jgi:hypothetical protein